MSGEPATERILRERGPHRGRRILRAVGWGVLLQTSGCSFDADAFVSESVATWLGNVSTNFILTGLANVLKVTPSFGF